MKKSKDEQSDFFNPENFYTLPSSALFVWLSCLVSGYIFVHLSPSTFRVIGISFSFLVSLSLFLKQRKWRKSYHYILILANTLLIFINATGFNTITYSIANNPKLNHNEIDVKQNSFLNLSNQVLWWPDYKLLKRYDSLQVENQNLKTANQDLINQYSSLEDWIKTKIMDKSTKDSLDAFLKKIKATSSINKPPQANAGANQNSLLPRQPPVIDAGSDTVIQLPANTAQKDSSRDTVNQLHP